MPPMVAGCAVPRNAGEVQDSGIPVRRAPRLPSSLFPRRPIRHILVQLF